MDDSVERLAGPRRDRRCGIAALAMVLESLGVRYREEDLWQEASCDDGRGGRAAATYLLARSAALRGLAALTMQSRDPWQSLAAAVAASLPVVLNHRLRGDSPLGHFSVLESIDATTATLRDPQSRLSLRLEREHLLDLWTPRFRGCEIRGNILIGIARKSRESAWCRVCSKPLPPAITCRRCHHRLPLQPALLLGCVDATCSGRRFARVYCLRCDLGTGRLST